MKVNAPFSLRSFCVALAIGTLFFSTRAFPQTAVSLGLGTVTWIEATYMPGEIVFTLSTGDTLCGAGTPLHWITSDVDNAKAVYAILLANMLSGRQVYAQYLSTTRTTDVPSGHCRVWFVGSYSSAG